MKILDRALLLLCHRCWKKQYIVLCILMYIKNKCVMCITCSHYFIYHAIIIRLFFFLLFSIGVTHALDLSLTWFLQRKFDSGLAFHILAPPIVHLVVHLKCLWLPLFAFVSVLLSVRLRVYLLYRFFLLLFCFILFVKLFITKNTYFYGFS